MDKIKVYANTQLKENGSIQNNLGNIVLTDYESQSNFIGGLLESVEICKGLDLVCDEEGLLKKDLKNSLVINHENSPFSLIRGSWFLTGVDYTEGSWIGLQDYEISFFEELFEKEGLKLDYYRNYVEEAIQYAVREGILSPLFNSKEYSIHHDGSQTYIFNKNNQQMNTKDLSDKDLLNEYIGVISVATPPFWFDENFKDLIIEETQIIEDSLNNEKTNVNDRTKGKEILINVNDETHVLRKTEYSKNNRIALAIVNPKYPEDYEVVTTFIDAKNLDDFETHFDTNNYGSFGILDSLKNRNIVQVTGENSSGYCSYPKIKVNVNLIKDIREPISQLDLLNGLKEKVDIYAEEVRDNSKSKEKDIGDKLHEEGR